MSRSLPCAGILLAAGASTRLGYPKQLLLFEGETLIHRAARIATDAGLSPVSVVLGSQAEALRPWVADLPVQIVVNPEWQSGMASSLRRGLQSLGNTDGHALILVCDQVGLTRQQLVVLLQAARQSPERIIASSYGGRTGVPAVFPSKVFPDLLKVEGDAGARGLLDRCSTQVVPVPFASGIADIDTPEDVERAGLEMLNPMNISPESAKSHKK